MRDGPITELGFDVRQIQQGMIETSVDHDELCLAWSPEPKFIPSSSRLFDLFLDAERSKIDLGRTAPSLSVNDGRHEAMDRDSSRQGSVRD